MSHLLNKPEYCDKLGEHIGYKLFKEWYSFTGA